jgi:hypothetical protein
MEFALDISNKTICFMRPTMPASNRFQKITVFVACPSDMANEKGLLERVIASLNQTLGDHTGLMLELKEWSSVIPSMGRPENVILDELPVQEWDIFVGLMWLKFGQPTGNKDKVTRKKYSSGTEEEFTLAYKSWSKNGRPNIMFYRCIRAPKTITQINSIQYRKVEKFFAQFDAVKGKHPGLYKEFDQAIDFEREVNKHFAKIMLSYGEQKNTGISSAKLDKLLAPVKSNLPRKTTFFGRETELEFALKALSPEVRPWGLVIDGIGGIGKTALAVETAYQCQERSLFDEYIFITAKELVLDSSGIHRTLLKESNLDEFLNELSRRIGRADLAQPIDPARKQKEILDALQDRRVLIIFDNVETLPKSEQKCLADLLNRLPGGSKAIITTREAVGGGLPLRLDKLSWEDSFKIIKNQLEIQGTKNFPALNDLRWKELYDHTGGSPLALIWSIGLIRTLSFEVILGRFRDGIQGDLSEFLYAESFKQMDENEKCTICALAFFETPTTREGISQTSGIPLRSIDTVLERLRFICLVNVANIVTTDVFLERYSLHPLTKKYAMEDLIRNEQLHIKIGMNFSNYWLDFIRRPTKLGLQETFDSINAEWKNFETVLEWLWKTSGIKNHKVVDRASANLLIQLCDALQEFLVLNDRIDDLAKINSWGFQCSTALGNSASAERLARNTKSYYEKMGLLQYANIWAKNLRLVSKISRKLRVFVSSASEDKQIVRKLTRKLEEDGYDTWLDEKQLLPGQDWQMEIEHAMRNCDVILLCFSEKSIAKTGYIQREYKRAMDLQEEKPEGVTFVIPVRLDRFTMPDFLQRLQVVDFPAGYKQLLATLASRYHFLGL